MPGRIASFAHRDRNIEPESFDDAAVLPRDLYENFTIFAGEVRSIDISDRSPQLDPMQQKHPNHLKNPPVDALIALVID